MGFSELKVICTGSVDGNCYVLKTDSGKMIVLDSGGKMNDITKGIDYNVSDVAAVLITHEHLDHSKNALKLADKVPVYMNSDLYGILSVNASWMQYQNIVSIPGLVRTNVSDDITVIPFDLPHTTKNKEKNENVLLLPCMNFGYLITHRNEKVLYMTDFEYCKYNFKSSKIDHMIIECNYCDEYVNKEAINFSHRLQGHCSLDTCKKFISENITEKLKTVTIVHVSETAGNPAMIKEEIQNIVGPSVKVEIARKGLAIDLTCEAPF